MEEIHGRYLTEVETWIQTHSMEESVTPMLCEMFEKHIHPIARRIQVCLGNYHDAFLPDMMAVLNHFYQSRVHLGVASSGVIRDTQETTEYDTSCTMCAASDIDPPHLGSYQFTVQPPDTEAGSFNMCHFCLVQICSCLVITQVFDNLVKLPHRTVPWLIEYSHVFLRWWVNVLVEMEEYKRNTRTMVDMSNLNLYLKWISQTLNLELQQ
jgi:hypothetical protein